MADRYVRESALHDNQNVAGTWPDELIEAALVPRSPISKKLWLVDAYARRWISAEQVSFWFYVYALHSV